MYPVDPYNPGSNIPQMAGATMPGAVMPGMPIQGTAMPVGAVNQFQGIQYVLVQDPLTELDNCKGVLIKQQPEILEAYTGCETPNRYHVFGETPNGYLYLFKCFERSGYCMRNCCASNMREFNMDVLHVTQVGVKKFANVFKPFKCPCFCCNRPIINVYLSDGNSFVGRITHTFTCCDPEFEVYDANGHLKYFVHADCCQCGLLCSNNFCGKMSTATFNILSTSNNVVGNITKMTATYAEMITDADSYYLAFPPDANASDKFLLIALGLMIDYQYFETSPGDKGNRGAYGYGRRIYI